jgi:hypothetical protein
MQDQLATPLPLVKTRIATGITCGGLLISIFFSIWALVQHKGGPVIGVLVFQVIAFAASVYLSAKLIFEKNKVDFI